MVLVIVANGAPVVVRNLVSDRWAWPVDAGHSLPDGHRLFGASKTWRGIISACLAAAVTAPLLGLPALTGLAAGALAMLGDLSASFAKRRLAYPSSAHSPLLDSLPEILVPAIALRGTLALSWLEVLIAAVVFHVLVHVASPLLYRLHIRRRPW
ncbi:MAG: CDP-archaeol synthase [Gammaproteobacteria bacterium]|nr:CDP-archaeol synthase [Gammaproteobacteria bacterium]